MKLFLLLVLVDRTLGLQLPTTGMPTRRAALGCACVPLVFGPACVQAFFESQTERSLQSLASSLPRVQSLLGEVREVKRLRLKLPADPEDDAYVLRFSRAVLQPLNVAFTDAMPGLGDGVREYAEAFRDHVSALDQACRDRQADDELNELQGVEQALKGVLALGAAKKIQVSPKEDINTYSGATNFLYSKWLFRAG
eukprot:CAMPEP_0119379300 /NCGR_PEP_ID=MMETSP1334-20130426/52064_1 /TAXON_ID=127549 /ORGANISM="Calcidiscus leptoporus, Strain RCC1130" /LENGTH=195 /DNA_ID=CAMNT_0007398771 /DNA_START=13 /DNA_END=600 /DNA_ORIENTATION=-